MPQAARFPQRGKSAGSEAAVEGAGKKQHVKRPSLELVDSHSFVTDEKDKGSKGPRIIETELSKSELIETVSKSSVAYASSTVEPAEDDEETTPLMEKVAFDLYAILQNENAKEDDKKGKSEVDETTVSGDEEATTVADVDTEKPATTTTTTTKAPTTTRTTTTTTEAPTTTTEAPRGRAGLPGARNRFNLKSKSPSATTAAASADVTTESTKPKGRFNRPPSSFSRSSGSKAAKTTSTPEEVKENVEKSSAPTQSSSKLGSKARNRFSAREKPTYATTEKAAEVEAATPSRLLKPRPQFSLRGRGRSGPSTAAPAETSEATEENADDKEEKPVEKAAPIVPRPTSRLNLNRPSNRQLPGSKPRTSPLSGRRGNDESSDGNKSANENESDLETTTQNNLNKLKSRPRITINTDSKVKKTASPAIVNRKSNPLISKRKFGVTSTTGEDCFAYPLGIQ